VLVYNNISFCKCQHFFQKFFLYFFKLYPCFSLTKYAAYTII